MKTIFLAIFTFIPLAIFGQKAVLHYDQKTGQLSQDQKLNDFKVGTILEIKVTNYDPTAEILNIQYRSSNNLNEDLFKKFSGASAEAFDEDKAKNPNYFFKIANADVSTIVFKKYSKDFTALKSEESFSFNNRGGWRFDVSSGAFATNLRNEQYVLKTVDTSSTGLKEIIAENNGKFRVGLGLLAHLHYRSAKFYSFGVSTGFELNSDAKVSYLLGGSIFLGTERKFVISGGFAASKVEVISNEFKGKQFVDASVSTVALTSIWKAGFFGGISYNF